MRRVHNGGTMLRCPHCDASMMEHKHGLSKPVIEGLRALAECGGGPLRRGEFLPKGQDHSKYTNFSILKHWGFCAQVDVNDERGAGWLTQLFGWEFLSGLKPAFKYVWTYRNEVVEFEGPEVYIQELTDGWWYAGDYRKFMRPHQ